MSELLPVAWLNGRFLPLGEARISPLDRGFLFGEGVYEVIPVYAGVALKLASHMQRLSNSCHEIGLENPLADGAGSELVRKLIADNGGGNQSVYIQITRGADDGPRNHIYPGSIEPTVFAMCQSCDPRDESIARTGVAAVTRADTRWQRCDIKSTSLIANTILRQDAHESGAVESILLRDGRVTEGAASTVLVVTDGVVTTPPHSHQILPGTTLGLIAKLLSDAGIEIHEADIDEAALRGADEIWLCSSVREVLPVCRLDGATIGDGHPGPHWQTLDRLYQQHKREQAAAS